MVQKEVQFPERKVLPQESGGVYWNIRGAPCFRSLPPEPRQRPPPRLSLRGSGAKGRAEGWGRGSPGTKAAAAALGLAGAARSSCRRPGPGRPPAPGGARSAMEGPGAPRGPAPAEPACPPPAPPPPPPLPPSRPAAPAAAPRSANMAAAGIGRDTLPEHWSYGVCRDGRVFFIKCGAGTRTAGGGEGPGGMRAGRASPGWRRR